jgi:hypothetical protein
MPKKKYRKDNKISYWDYVLKLLALIGVISTIGTPIYFYYDIKYEIDRKNDLLELNNSKDSLDLERSRIKLTISNKISTFDFDKIFIEPTEINNSLIQIGNTPFFINHFNGNEEWSWKKSNSREIMYDYNPYILNNYANHTLLDLVDELSDLYAYERKGRYIIKLDSITLNIRPRITFETTSFDKIKEFYNYLKIHMDNTGINLITKDTIQDLNSAHKKLSFLTTKNGYFHYFLQTFNYEKETQLGQFLGEYNISEYYFNKDEFLINGYYVINNENYNEFRKLYLLLIGFMKNEKFYYVKYNIPIKDDINDVKLLNSIIHGFRILK